MDFSPCFEKLWAMRPVRLQKIHGQPSWPLGSDKVSAILTKQGGHLGPVTFRLGNRTVSPYSVAPWAEEKIDPALPPVLQGLRGDFFCAPFGGNETAYRGERHPPHGESANCMWRFASCSEEAIGRTWRWSLETAVRPGQIEKIIALKEGETNLYCRHLLSQMDGPMDFGHHAMLKFPEGLATGVISTSKLHFGQVAPVPFELPENRGYSSLKTGSRFTRLDRVPANAGGFADLRFYPARQGYEDLVLLAHQAEPDFAWTAVTFPSERYVWFSLKDPQVLKSTIFWISNGGRHYAPWNGRHLGVLGIEEVTAYFHYGLAESVRQNPLNKAGIATCVRLKKSAPLMVNYIMGVVEIPKGFDRVKQIERVSGGIRLRADSGLRVEAKVATEFLSAEHPSGIK